MKQSRKMRRPGTATTRDETRNQRFPESPPPYAGDHAAMDFDASRNGADSIVRDEPKAGKGSRRPGRGIR